MCVRACVRASALFERSMCGAKLEAEGPGVFVFTWRCL